MSIIDEHDTLYNRNSNRDWEMYDDLNDKIKTLEDKIAKLEKRQKIDLIGESNIVSRVLSVLMGMEIGVKSTLDIQSVSWDPDKNKHKEREV